MNHKVRVLVTTQSHLRKPSAQEGISRQEGVIIIIIKLSKFNFSKILKVNTTNYVLLLIFSLKKCISFLYIVVLMIIVIIRNNNYGLEWSENKNMKSTEYVLSWFIFCTSLHQTCCRTNVWTGIHCIALV